MTDHLLSRFFILQEKLKTIVWESEAFKNHPVLMEPLWGECVNAIYNVQPQFQELGIWDKVMNISYIYII